MSQEPFRYQRLGYLAINVTDLERSVAFYRDVVGLERVREDAAGVAFMRGGNVQYDLILHRHRDAGLKRLGFELVTIDDLSAAENYLRELDVPYDLVTGSELSTLGHARALRFRVPGCAAMFELYVTEDGRAAPFHASVANLLRLGHCVIKVREFDTVLEWLTQRLGFKVSDHICGDRGEIVFLRCWPNPYHHSLAIARAERDQLHHFAFMVGDIDDIGRGNNRLPKAGTRVVFGPGRHVASGSVFLYFLDPDGMTVEYTCGMEEFPASAARDARLLPPTLEVADMWGSAPAPEACSLGSIEGADTHSSDRTGSGVF